MRLGGTEEGGGDAEAGDEEEKGRANHLRLQDSWACGGSSSPLEEVDTLVRAYLSILKLRSPYCNYFSRASQSLLCRFVVCRLP